MPNEKKSRVLGELAGAQRRARQLDHRADLVVEPALLGNGASRQLDQPLQLRCERDERVHDLDDRQDARRRSTACAARTIALICIS